MWVLRDRTYLVDPFIRSDPFPVTDLWGLWGLRVADVSDREEPLETRRVPVIVSPVETG